MALLKCPDCGAQVSDKAPACPQCGRPILAREGKVDIVGAWCPHCGNRESAKKLDAGCVFWIFVLLTMGGALLLYPFLPRSWICARCRNRWKA